MSKAQKQDAKSAQADKHKVESKTEKKTVSEKNVKPSKIAQFIDYLQLSKAELRKVSWPTYSETKKTTLVVFVFVAIMAALLGLVDLALSSLIGLILS